MVSSGLFGRRERGSGLGAKCRCHPDVPHGTPPQRSTYIGLLLLQGPPGPTGPPGLIGEQGISGPRVSPLDPTPVFSEAGARPAQAEVLRMVLL